MKNTYVARCYESHPALSVGSGLVIYGGSCAHPVVTDADVYVGLDFSMRKTPQAYPWMPGDEFLFPITDMQAPNDPKLFAGLIDWLAVQLTANRKVHVGCIGGHGRTGTVLAAVVSVMMGRKDAIEYVRQNYCVKAVESKAQVMFLREHFGVDDAPPAKAPSAWSSRGPSARATNPNPPVRGKSEPAMKAGTPPPGNGLLIWGPGAMFDKFSNSASINII